MTALPAHAWRDALGLVLLTLALLLAGTALAQPGQQLLADSPHFGRALVRFHALEQNPTTVYRWSQPVAALFLYGFDGRPALVTLRLAAPRPPNNPLAELHLVTGGQPLGHFTLTDQWRHYHVLSPTRPAGETSLRLVSSALTSVDDPREKGVALSQVTTRSTHAPGWALVRPGWLLGWPLLGWLLTARLGGSRRMGLLVGVALALVVGWAAAFPSASGYWLPTLGWPWWPLLPMGLLLLAPGLQSGLARARSATQQQPLLAYLGLGLALLALLGLRLGLPIPVGMAALIVGIWASFGLGLGPPGPDTPREQLPTPLLALSLVAITGLALGLRLVALDGQPAGLWRDESRHGLQALRIWNDATYRPIYVAEGADLPALLFYLMASVVGVFGPAPGTARLVSALAGAFTPLALYWAAGPLVGRRAALVAAILLAGASWALSMSRWAFPATLDHLLVLTAIGMLWRSLPHDQRPTPHWLGLVLAGLLGGLALYAYHTGRVAPLALAAVAGLRLGTQAHAWRRAAPGLALAALVGLLTIAPLVNYIISQSDDYNRRVGSVSVLDRIDLDQRTPAGLLLDNLGRYALAYHALGDPNGRHHQPQAPLLDPFAGLLLALGFGLALRHRRHHPGLALALALGAIYLIPAALSNDAPHAMRALGTLAPACILAGTALVALINRLPTAGLRQTVPLLMVVASLLFSGWVYFDLMRTNPLVYGEFDLVETALGRVVQTAARCADPEIQAVAIYLPERLRRSDTLRFLSWDSTTGIYTGEPLPPDGPALILLPATASPAEQALALAALGPAAQALGPTAVTPGSATPLTLAFGRGAAAGQLVELMHAK
ncbi:MAG: glycosyltransferase family 39 protein [Oscillochloridaceae bacterium umkhey_bin13]